MDSRPVHIYALRDPRTSEIRYVGKTVNFPQRFSLHKWGHGDPSRKTEWLKELNVLGLFPKMETLEITDASHWPERERYWIAKLRSEGVPLFNVRDGGEVTAVVAADKYKRVGMLLRGKKRSAETRARMSKALQGHTVPQAARARLSLIGKLRWAAMSAEEQERQRNLSRGRKQTPEEKAKQINAQLGKRRAIKIGLKPLVPTQRKKRENYFTPASRLKAQEGTRRYLASLTEEQRKARMVPAVAAWKAKHPPKPKRTKSEAQRARWNAKTPEERKQYMAKVLALPRVFTAERREKMRQSALRRWQAAGASAWSRTA